jgi:hypothetical protein
MKSILSARRNKIRLNSLGWYFAPTQIVEALLLNSCRADYKSVPFPLLNTITSLTILTHNEIGLRSANP